MVREARNASKIEAKSGRISQLPIDPTETIMQGDLLFWDTSLKLATKMTTAADGATFVGVSDHSNPQTTAGSLTSDYTKSYLNAIQIGLVEMIAGANETLTAFQPLEMVTDAQHVKSSSTATQIVGVVDPGWSGGGAGKTVAIGDTIKLWLRVDSDYMAFGGRDAT